MKKSILLFTLLLIGWGLQAQKNIIDKHFSEIRSWKDVETILVPKSTFQELSNPSNSSDLDKDLLETFRQIDGIEVIISSGHSFTTDYLREIQHQLLTDKTYELLMEMGDEHSFLKMLIRENEQGIQELATIHTTDYHLMIASIYGDIDLKKMSTLLNNMRDEKTAWYKHFQNIENTNIIVNGEAIQRQSAQKSFEDNNFDLKIFPNPSIDHITIESLKPLQQPVHIEIYNLSGVKIKEFSKVVLPYDVPLADLSSATYFIRVNKADGTFKNYRIIKN